MPQLVDPVAEEEEELPGREYYNDAGVKKWRPILTGKEAKATFNKIPEIDVSQLYSSDPDVRKKLSKEIGDHCRETGFLILTNPPVRPETIDNVFSTLQEFFRLTLEEKLKCSTALSSAAKGYDAFLPDTWDHSNGGNSVIGRESFGLGNDLTEMEQQKMTGKTAPEGSHSLNLWPEAAPGVREAFYAYYNEVYPFAKALIRSFSLALGLEENDLDDRFKSPIFDCGVLRRCATAPPSTLTVNHPPHGDFSWLTLLAQNGVSGLQVLNANGVWIDVPATKHSYVVNTGTYLTLASNGAFPSTIHRVINRTGEERLSLPFFVSPDISATISPIPECVGKDAKIEYEPILVSRKHVEKMFGRRQTHPTVQWFQKMGLEPVDRRWEMLYTVPVV